MKNKRLLGICIFLALAIITYITFCLVVKFNNCEPLPIDIWVRDLAYNIRGEKGGFGYWFFRIVTELGFTYFVVGLIVIGAFHTKCNRRWVCFVFCILIQYATNEAIKNAFDRVRPLEEMWWMHESSSSFPSGHSATTGATYSFLIYSMIYSNHKKLIKNIFLVIFSAIMVIVPISRIILGMHYFSDCIAGLTYGFIVSGAFMLINETLKKQSVSLL